MESEEPSKPSIDNSNNTTYPSTDSAEIQITVEQWQKRIKQLEERIHQLETNAKKPDDSGSTTLQHEESTPVSRITDENFHARRIAQYRRNFSSPERQYRDEDIYNTNSPNNNDRQSLYNTRSFYGTFHDLSYEHEDQILYRRSEHPTFDNVSKQGIHIQQASLHHLQQSPSSQHSTQSELSPPSSPNHTRYIEQYMNFSDIIRSMEENIRNINNMSPRHRAAAASVPSTTPTQSSPASLSHLSSRDTSVKFDHEVAQENRRSSSPTHYQHSPNPRSPQPYHRNSSDSSITWDEHDRYGANSSFSTSSPIAKAVEKLANFSISDIRNTHEHTNLSGSHSQHLQDKPQQRPQSRQRSHPMNRSSSTASLYSNSSTSSNMSTNSAGSSSSRTSKASRRSTKGDSSSNTEVEEAPIPYSKVRHLQQVVVRGGCYNHSTMDWYLSLCGNKYMTKPAPGKKAKVVFR